MQLQNIQDHVQLFKMTWNSSLRRPLDKKERTLGEGLSSRPIVGLQRQAGCHLPHIFHEYPQIYISVSKSACDMFQQSCLSLCLFTVRANCKQLAIHYIAWNTLHFTQLWAAGINPPSPVRPPFSVRTSICYQQPFRGFQSMSRWPYVVTLRRYAPCPWFHHHNSTVTLKKIDVSSTNWWIHSAHRCGVSPVPNIPKIMPLTWFLWNITIW